MKFVLFDIDGTLLDSGGAGMRSLDFAFEEVFSVREAFRTVGMAGKTDLQIMREGLRLHGIPYANGAVPAFLAAYLRHLKDQVNNDRKHLKKGIPEALEAIESRDEYVLGLLTGNIEEGARIKLEALGINSYFDVGAFGSDDEDRNRLLPVAVEKLYTQRSIRVGYGDCVVIGDTPRDVECSKPYGAVALAVATGPYPFSVLSETAADVVLEDLSDTEGLMSILSAAGRK